MQEELLNNISDEEMKETGELQGNICCTECTYESGQMDIKSSVFKVNMQGGYYMYDGEGGPISKCPSCQRDSLFIYD